MDLAFDLMNSCHPLSKGIKQPVTCPYFKRYWAKACYNLTDYIFALKDERGNLLRNGRHKTVIWGFAFSIQSVKAMAEELLYHSLQQFHYVLTYKFSQDPIELLFNKIQRWGGWNNNPSAKDFRLALRRIVIRNSIEPSKTGNCTNFEDAFSESQGLLDFSWKRKQKPVDLVDSSASDTFSISAERMLIENDLNSPNILRDNVLYYASGFIVSSLLSKLDCTSCRSELLLDPNDCYASNMSLFPFYAKFTTSKQKGGLVFPSIAVLKIVKATEVIFRRKVIENDIGISKEKHLDQKIQNSVLEHLGLAHFRSSLSHFYDHTVGEERDHLSSLL